MTMIRPALRDSGATAVVSRGTVSALFLLLVHAALRIASLENKVVSLFLISLVIWPCQGFLVGKRRCSGHWLVQYTAMAAYYLPSPLAFYTVHAVCSTSTHESFDVTAGIVLFLLELHMISFPDRHVMRAYSLRDGPPDPSRFVLSVVYLACVEWEWNWNSRMNRGLLPLLLIMIPYFVLALAFLIVASKPPKSTLDYETKAVAEYMKRGSKSSSPFFDDGGSGGDGDALDYCRYPFTQRKDGQWISIKDLFHLCRDLPSSYKDFWLSYSLSRLLARRYYGFHCAEEGDDKVRHLALAGLGLGTTDGYKRAFSVVEVQLAFLHDYFFTTSPRVINSKFFILPKKIRTTIVGAPVVCAIIAGLVEIVQHNNSGFAAVVLFLSQLTTTILMFYWVAAPEYFLSNYWRPIHIVFHKLDLVGPLNTIRIWVWFLLPIFSPKELDVYRPLQTQTSTDYWRDKIGQYSLLLDYDRRRSPKKALIAWFQGLVRSQPQYMFIKHLPVEEKDVRVLDSVRKLVADTLRAIDGPPTNGTRSLKINKDRSGYEYDWSWTCRQETHTCTILIWHIATCYCDMSRRHIDQPDEDFPLLVETDTFHEVATALSRYCAYLVAFLPEFLPEHSLITKEVFQTAIKDTQRALGSRHMEEKEKHTKIQKLELPPEDRQTIFHMGVRLGRLLEKLNTRLRWKVMAEFWAETILYIAPSDNVEAHIEHLAKGGEFVTHLWAMLSNAGILKRATGEWHSSASTTKKAPPKKTETTKARTQECPF